MITSNNNFKRPDAGCDKWGEKAFRISSVFKR